MKEEERQEKSIEQNGGITKYELVEPYKMGTRGER